MPFTDEFDVIGACDVLEHIPRTNKYYRSRRALVPGGRDDTHGTAAPLAME